MSYELDENGILTEKVIIELIDLAAERNYASGDGVFLNTFDVYPLLQAQHQAGVHKDRAEIGNELNEICPVEGEEKYKCPRCVRQIRDRLLTGIIHEELMKWLN